jgi:hypothetical protein
MDDGSEYQATLKTFLIEKGIASDITIHYSPESNGIWSVLTGLFSIWPASYCLEPIYQINSGQRQFLLLSISRIGFLTLICVGILFLMRCNLGLSYLYLIFIFSPMPLTFTSLRNIARELSMERSAIALSISIS